MKFIVDEFPKCGWECPFFSLGWCHNKIASSDTGNHKCPIFNDYGYRVIGVSDSECNSLTKHKDGRI